ncbi:MAG: glycosyltransferase family 4 protein [Pseudomonadota bacterium]
MQAKKIAIISAAPIPNQVSVWRALAKQPGIHPKVFYASRNRMLPSDPMSAFSTTDNWDIDLFSGYEYELLRNNPQPEINWRYRYSCSSIHYKLDEGDFDALLMVGKEYVYYLQAFHTARRQKIPVLFMGDTPPQKKHLIESVLAFAHRRAFYKRVAAFLIGGKDQYHYYSSYGIQRERMFWAPCCVDNDYFQSQANKHLPNKDAIRKKLGFPSTTKIIAFSGRFARIKRPMDLLHAFEQIASKGDFGLLFVGDGELKASCELFAKNARQKNTRFVGFKNMSELGEIYAAADCLVLPSEHGETWGLVLNEVMNFGLPVVASDQVGAAQDLILPDENGYIYPMGDIDALAHSILRVFEDDQKAMGARSKEIVSEYSVETRVKGILRALEYVTA